MNRAAARVTNPVVSPTRNPEDPTYFRGLEQYEGLEAAGTLWRRAAERVWRDDSVSCSGSGAGEQLVVSEPYWAGAVLRGGPDVVAAIADSLEFEHKYTSGVIAWAPDDRPTDEQIEAVLDEFEKGRSLNIAPPGWRRTFDPLRDAFNDEHGWSRPDDPYPVSNYGAYGAAKFGVRGFTGITGLEGRPHGVKATLVEPGPMGHEDAPRPPSGRGVATRATGRRGRPDPACRHPVAQGPHAGAAALYHLESGDRDDQALGVGVPAAA